MRQRDRGPLVGSDQHDHFLFGSDEDQDGDQPARFREDWVERTGGPERRPSPRPTRSQDRRGSRPRRGRGVFLVAGALLAVLVIAAAFFVAVPVYRYLHPSDYTGSGSGSVVVTVQANDDATQIAGRLLDRHVVASVRAFTDAATNDTASQNIQPGSYRMRLHMSATSALHRLLDPSSRVNSDVVVTEGATVVDIERRLTAAPCSATSPDDAVCGLGLSVAAVKKALGDASSLGLPTDFTVSGKVPTSAEGFLFPATYAFDTTTGADDALQQMVSKFTDEARSTDFADQARRLGVTPYQELTIASIAQAEAKYPADMARVARVILNRLQAHMPLQIDATSAYAFKLKGLDPTTQIYADAQGPYNTYNHGGLPPTPIGNPGEVAMQAAAHPTAGNWLYYVNGDAAGHLVFTASEAQFEKDAARCRANHWGCG